VPPDRIHVVLNAPDLARFRLDEHPHRPFMADGELRLVYAGAVTPIYELDVVVRAIARLVCGAVGEPPVPFRVRFDIYGRGDSAERIASLAADLGVADRVVFHGRIPLEAVAGQVAAADVGLAPTRRDAFTDFSLSTKIFEYAAMGKVAVCSRLPTVERYVGGAVLMYEPGDPIALAAGLRQLVADPALRARLMRAADARVHAMSWDTESERYVKLVNRLARR
jgi:glycosyltransferase involved in cell wall biosynthesis